MKQSLKKYSRKNSNTDSNIQFDQITKKQQKAVKEKPSSKDTESEWEGAKVPKQQKINSVEKSKQNMKIQNKQAANNSDCE